MSTRDFVLVLGSEIGGGVLPQDSIDGFNFGAHKMDQKNHAS